MSELLKTNVQVEPVATVYNFTNRNINDFVYNLLTEKRKIDGVEAVKTIVVKDGQTNPKVDVYIFISLDSKDVKSSAEGVPEPLREKLADSTYQYSDNLKSALWSICRRIDPSIETRENILMVKADIFKIIGLMLAADPKRFDVGVVEAIRLKKDNSIISVMKKAKFTLADEGAADKYDNLIHKFVD